ncbi:MAG: hypothetical protein IKJ94_04530 [Oscillospiraceae bacterium]|nr:hypothetical protein [Oscillospiraceae bacterium]
MNDMHRFGLVRFSKKTGKIDTSMTALGCALLQLWALQSTTKTKACVIVDLVTREVFAEFEGTPGGFPNVRKKPEDFIFEVPDALIDELQRVESKRDNPA